MVLAASDLVDALWGLDVLGQRPSDEQLNRLVILGTVGEEQAAVVGEIVVGEFCRLPVLQAQFCRLPRFAGSHVLLGIGVSQNAHVHLHMT